MKKITLALAAAAMLTAASAETSNFTGFYLGANVGAGSTVTKMDIATPNAAAGAHLNSKLDSGKTSFLFGLFAGYGMTFSGSGYFGGEIYGGFDNAKVTGLDDNGTDASSRVAKLTLKRTNFFGAAVRLGYLITPSTLFYIKAGAETGKWKLDVDNLGGTVTSKSKSGVYFVPGLGVETFFNKNLFMRAEYSLTFAPKISVAAKGRFAAGATFGDVYNASAKSTYQHAFKLGLGYKF